VRRGPRTAGSGARTRASAEAGAEASGGRPCVTSRRRGAVSSGTRLGIKTDQMEGYQPRPIKCSLILGNVSSQNFIKTRTNYDKKLSIFTKKTHIKII